MITEIYHVSSRCGGGKSQNTLSELYQHRIKHPDETVVFASKTIVLTHQNHASFLNFVANGGAPTPSVRVDSSTVKGSVVRELSDLLTEGYTGIIFTSHEAISRINPRLLHKVRLIVDEVPKELVESIMVSHEAKDHGAPWEKFITTYPSSYTGYDKTVIHPLSKREDVQRYIDNIREKRDNTVAQDIASLLDFLLADYEVMYTTVIDASGRVFRLYQAIHWRKLDQIIKNVAHFAILSAQLKNTLLGFVAEHHCKVLIRTVPITHQTNLEAKHRNRVRIFPLLTGSNWSSTLKEKPANEALSYQGSPVASSESVIIYAQQVAEKALAQRPCLLALNKDDPLHTGFKKRTVERITIAVHGSNSYRHFDHAIYLASSRPDPYEVKSLRMFAENNNLDKKGILEAVLTERCYEAAYQCIARTSIRNPKVDLEKEHIFVVPDLEYAKYIQNWFEPGCAVIDTRYSHTTQRANRQVTEREKRRSLIIKILTDIQTKRGRQKDLITESGISPSSFKRYREEFRTELEELGLTRPKRTITKTDTKTVA